MSQQQNTNLFTKFPLLDKILMRIGLYTLIFIGIYAIFIQSRFWGLIYIAYIIISAPTILYCLCSHCPHPYKFSDCLFIPFGLIKKLFKFNPQPLNILEKIIFILMSVGLIIIPQYWLLKNYTILIIYWVIVFPFGISIPICICKRCQNFACPFNSVDKKREMK